MLSYFVFFAQLAPDRGPDILHIIEVTDYSIWLSWEPVDCSHQNSEILGYRVLYGQILLYQEESETIGDNNFLLTGLSSNTTYTFQVFPVTATRFEGFPVQSGRVTVRTMAKVRALDMY